jgi:hypothetical protein
MKLYESQFLIGFPSIGIKAWREWFPTTILDGGLTEFIAVTNRSHTPLFPALEHSQTTYFG